MKIDNLKLKSYLIHEIGCRYKLCKILKEYDKKNKEKLDDDLVALLFSKNQKNIH